MANHRMFSLDILDTDAFLDMPPTTQNLYIHIGMRADDDGVCDNVNKIIRFTGSSQSDLEVLIEKRFLLLDVKGLIIVKHWWIHNTKRKDRYKPSNYLKDLTLYLDENGAYTFEETDNIYTKEVKTILGEIGQKKELEGARKLRYEARKNSDLPSSFDYKIRQAFNGKICPVCHLPMDLSNNTRKPTIQHNVPISLGGKHEIDNISVICQHCNTSLQNKTITGKLNNDEVKFVWEQIGNGSGMATQDKISKDKISKDKISECSKKTPAHTQELNLDELLKDDLFNSLTVEEKEQIKKESGK